MLQRAMALADADQWRAAAADAQAAVRTFWQAHDIGAAARSLVVEGDVLRMMGLHVAAKTKYLAAAYAAGAHMDLDVMALSAESLLRTAQQEAQNPACVLLGEAVPGRGRGGPARSLE